MARKPPSAVSIGITVVLIAVATAWTVLVLTVPGIAESDAALARPGPLAPLSAAGQIATTVALITEPVLIYLGLLIVAAVVYRDRLRNLAGALVLMAVLGMGGSWLAKLLIGRPRPEEALDLLTTQGSSYPSGHLTAATIASIAITTVLVVTRRRRVAQIRWSVIAAAVLVVIGLDRWLLAAHHLSDLIGGLLFGAAISAIALLISGVSVLPPSITAPARKRITRSSRATAAPEPARRCAVVYNPSKIADWMGFRRSVEYEARTRGWTGVIWLETTPEDPGREAARQALERGAELVIAAGGDGTVRVVAAEMAESGVPFAIIPAGTGNLLAKNLGIPLDEGEALEVAFGGHTRKLDIGRVTVDDTRTDHFVVAAGIGIDASIMQDTNPDLKKAVGSAAYFLSAARHTNHPAVHATITVDDGEPMRRRAQVLVVGNVGYLQANIALIPDARPDDGKLDLLVASPRTAADWAKIVGGVLTRRSHDNDDQLTRVRAEKFRIEVAEGDHFELDGDPAGQCHILVAEVLPGALSIRVPG